jgi:hypothetical protein
MEGIQGRSVLDFQATSFTRLSVDAAVFSKVWKNSDHVNAISACLHPAWHCAVTKRCIESALSLLHVWNLVFIAFHDAALFSWGWKHAEDAMLVADAAV